MHSPLDSGSLVDLVEVTSTQDVLAQAMAAGTPTTAVRAEFQTQGRGRFDRKWISAPGESLCLSLAFPAYADHEKPWLIGMAVAAAVAAAVHARVQWPNDITLDGKKLGGILTEIVTDPAGRRIAVVGIGLNLNQSQFPADLAERATSLAIHRSSVYDPKRITDQIIERIKLLPEPLTWDDLRPVWMLFDATPGKKFLLADESQAIGIGIGPEGELICAVDGETTTVLAADAVFGA